MEANKAKNSSTVGNKETILEPLLSSSRRLPTNHIVSVDFQGNPAEKEENTIRNKTSKQTPSFS